MHSIFFYNDIPEFLLQMDMFGLVLFLVAEVESAVSVGVNLLIKPRPLLQTFHLHLVHQQLFDLSTKALHLFHVLVVVGDDGSNQDVQHAQACHYDHNQVEGVECGHG